MPGLLHALSQRLRNRLERHHNLPFLKAMMAACAVVAIADGSIAFSQRIRIDQILETLETLKAFDPHEGVELFNHYAEAILADPKAGHTEAIKDIRPMAKDPDIARLLVRACRAVSEASGEISLVEKIELITLCSLLGVEPADCGLDPDYRDAIEAHAAGTPDRA